MSNTRKTAKPKPPKAADVELDIPLPGGERAIFYGQSELTPRRTRALDVQLTHLSPRMRQIAAARQVVAPDGAEVDPRAVLDGPQVAISEDEAAKFAAVNDLAAWVYLKDLRDRSGRRLPLPDSVDDVLDWPTPRYEAIVAHAAKLVAANMGDRFAIDTLGDDLDEADEDLPTSA